MIITYLLDIYHKCNQEILMLIIMIISIIPFIFFVNNILFSMMKNYIHRWHHDYEKILKKYSFYTYLLNTLLSIYFMFWSNILREFSNSYLLISIKNTVLILYTGSSITLLMLAFINAFTDIYQNKIQISAKLRPLSLYVQILKIIIGAIAIVIIISSILDITLGSFFTTLGAAAALLTFTFKDSILGLLASLQLISQDIIRIGDFVTINHYNTEGTIEKISITVVKIKNADQTISTIPTSSLLTTSVVNWRGMVESMAKKIQRSINIDINSIVFIAPTFLLELKKSPYLISDAVNEIDREGIKVNTYLTNIEIFRLYVKSYLKNNPNIYTKDFTFLVRQLAPSQTGLPIEIHIFTNKTTIDVYEEVQADIFAHLLAVLPEFQLKVFQK